MNIAMGTKQQPRNILLIIFAVMATYGISLRNGFVWDDAIFLEISPAYRTADLRKIFFSMANGVEYLPLRDITYVIDYAVWGENPFGFHLTNLVFAVANALAVYALARKCLQFLNSGMGSPDRETTALLASLLFLLHPIQAQAVSWVTGRNVLVSGVFFFLSVLFFIYVLERSDGGYRVPLAASVLLFVAALLSKLTSIMLPLLLAVFMTGWPQARGKRGPFVLFPYFLAATVFFFVARQIAIKGGAMPGVGTASVTEKIAVAVQVPFFYLRKLFVPTGFAADYDTVFDRTLSHPVPLAMLLLLLVCVAGAWLARKRYPVVSFGVAWYLVALVPVMNFFETNPIVADRYAFLPVFGVALIAAFALARLVGARKVLGAAVSGVTILVLSAYSLAQSRTWENGKTLWSNNIKVAPDNPMGYWNLGLACLDASDLPCALEQFTLLRRLDPAGITADLGMVHYYDKKGDVAAAIQTAERVLRQDTGNPMARVFLVHNHLQAGETAKALDYFQQMQLSKENDKWGLLDEAAQYVSEAAARLEKENSLADALDLYQALERSGREDWRLFHNTGNVYRKMGQQRQAVSYYRRALVLAPGNPDVLRDLGLAQGGRKDVSSKSR